jgi:hypothetical protein
VLQLKLTYFRREEEQACLNQKENATAEKPSLLSQLVALFSSAFRVIAAQQKFPNFSFDCWVDSLFAHPKIKTIPWQNESKESHDIVTILGIKKEHILAVKAIIGTHHIEKSSLRRTRRNVQRTILEHME